MNAHIAHTRSKTMALTDLALAMKEQGVDVGGQT